MTVKNVWNLCYNVMYNTSPLLLADQQMKIMRLLLRALRLAFTTENGQDMQTISACSEISMERIQNVRSQRWIIQEDILSGEWS